MQDAEQLVYAGFWIRVWASLIDSVLVSLLLGPVFWRFSGARDFGGLIEVAMTPPSGPGWTLLNYVLPAAAVILFWIYRSATPGKLLVGAEIVDAETGGKPTPGVWIIRYLGYFVSLLPLGLGFLWIAFDPRKQGWHDKLAGTVVVRRLKGPARMPPEGTEPRT